MPTEAAIKRNEHLVHELLDEVVDDGYVQTCNVEQLKPYISNEPHMPGPEAIPPDNAEGWQADVAAQSLARPSPYQTVQDNSKRCLSFYLNSSLCVHDYHPSN